jgi:hypothetical protein
MLSSLRPLLLVLSVSTLACVRTAPMPDVPDDQLADAPLPVAPRPLAQPAPRKFDAAAWVAEQRIATECEETAYALRRQAPNRAWLAMKACVELGRFRHGDKFVQIGVLVSHWADELTARPDGPRVVARVIANRGGDVEGDLLRFQDARVPIFNLAAAIAQPALYRGRLVMVHAKVSRINAEGDGAATLNLSEVSFRSVSNFRTRVAGGGSYFAGDARFTTIDNESNVTYPTGREGLGKIPQADPFMQPQREFVFLAKYEGNRPDDSGQQIAILTVLSYDAPTAYMVE